MSLQARSIYNCPLTPQTSTRTLSLLPNHTSTPQTSITVSFCTPCARTLHTHPFRLPTQLGSSYTEPIERTCFSCAGTFFTDADIEHQQARWALWPVMCICREQSFRGIDESFLGHLDCREVMLQEGGVGPCSGKDEQRTTWAPLCKCEGCGMTRMSLEKLKKHMDEEDQRRDYRCFGCRRGFRTRRELKAVSQKLLFVGRKAGELECDADER